ncbi:MAG: hypothetical protein NXY59_01670 [Aigarchaeota archaeon]|nr:hypothetical protein [Candidatus Pelearchaeum maunauluense]
MIRIFAIRSLFATKPSKWTVLGLATLTALLALQLIISANAGPPLPGWDLS